MKLKKVVRLAAGGIICLVGLYIGIRIGIIYGFVGGVIGIVRSVDSTGFVLNLLRMIFVGSIGVSAGVVIAWAGVIFGISKKRE